METPRTGLDQMLAGLGKLHKQGMHSDFKLIVASEDGTQKEWRVHKIILMCHSEQYLYKMSISGFKEGNDGSAVLKDVEARHIAAMVRYMYRLDYNVTSESWTESQHEIPPDTAILFHLEMARIGDMYIMPGLVDKAIEKMRALTTPDMLPGLIRTVYGNTETSKAVRKGLVTTTIRLMMKIRRVNAIHDTMDKAIGDVPEFAVEYLSQLIRGDTDEKFWITGS